MDVVVEGVQPWDGRYPLDLNGQELTTREYGWIKRLTGYLPVDLSDGLEKADPELVCAFAVIAMRRAGKIGIPEVPDVYERLIDAPSFSAVTLDTTADQPREAEPDPSASSTRNGSSSGRDSSESSESSPVLPSSSGTVGWDSLG
jgi:hypothetical protein